MRLVNEVIQASGEETGKVVLNAFEPCARFDLPRWHIDGRTHKRPCDNQYRFAIALKGASTMLYRLPDDKKEEFFGLYSKKNDMDRRQELAAFLGDAGAISFAQPNQGAIFLMGSPAEAAIHSEPAIKEPRLFLGIIPGSKAEIENWNQQHSSGDSIEKSYKVFS